MLFVETLNDYKSRYGRDSRKWNITKINDDTEFSLENEQLDSTALNCLFGDYIYNDHNNFFYSFSNKLDHIDPDSHFLNEMKVSSPFYTVNEFVIANSNI